MQHKVIIIILLLVSFGFHAYSQEYPEVKPRPGDGIINILQRYELEPSDLYMKKFREINRGKLGRRNTLKLHKHYALPILLINFNGKTIRSSINFDNFDSALNIQRYNERMHKAGLRNKDFRKDKILWLPYYSVPETVIKGLPESAYYVSERTTALGDDYASAKASGNVFPILGPDNEKVTPKSKKLNGHVYYLVGGHGGPDPGAIGKRAGKSLCEDEYAYDVILRLAKNLLEYGATVYVIVRDPDDGIRDEQYLDCDGDEVYPGNVAIDEDQLERLDRRCKIINSFYQKNRKTAKSQQVVSIHVDSRSVGKRIDIFFYHAPGSKSGKKLANTIHKTIRKKYRQAQPGRGYHGTVSARNLYVLRKTIPTAVFLELGNIRNTYDQIRFTIVNNRQAMANWICDGLIRSAR